MVFTILVLGNVGYINPKSTIILIGFNHESFTVYLAVGCYQFGSGYESAQKQKAKALGIDQDFKKIFVVNSLQKERKLGSFEKILELENIKPHELLCIGNSLSSEIKDAKKLGAVACYFEFGEDRGPVSLNPAEKPDYHVKHHFDIIPTCKLKI